MAMEIGCLISRISYSPMKSILTMTRPVINTSKGSVGKERPAPPVRSVRFTERGVDKTTNHMAQSNRYRVSHTTSKPAGKSKSSHHSLATIRPMNGKTSSAMMAMPLVLICLAEVTTLQREVPRKYREQAG